MVRTKKVLILPPIFLLILFFNNCAEFKSINSNSNFSGEINPKDLPFPIESLPEIEGLLKTEILSVVDLKHYFPKQIMQKKYKNSVGQDYATYTYSPNPSSFLELYDQHFNLQLPGMLGVWTKQYALNNTPATHALIFFGSDGSAIEVGDYYNKGEEYNNEFILFGYRNTSNFKINGLKWAHREGRINISNVVHPYSQNQSGLSFEFKETDKNTLAYAYVQAEKLDKFTPLYGSKDGVWKKGHGKKYSNVLRLRFYHGTNQGNINLDCSSKPGNDLKGYYEKINGFSSYVSEYYLAKEQWIIQERTLYIEDASYWRSMGQNIEDCSGAAFDKNFDDSYGAYYVEE